MNGSQIQATIERLRALLSEAREQMQEPAGSSGAAASLATIDAGLAGLAGEYQTLIAGYEAQIRDRVRVEADLRARSVLIHQVVNHAPIMFFMMDRDGVVSLCEGAAAPALGLDPRTLIGRSAFEVFAAYPVELGELRRALGGESAHWTGAYLNGFAEVWLIPLRENEAVKGVVAMGIDITDRVRAEQRLRERDALARQVVDHAPIILFALDRDGRITFTDGKGLALIGERPG